jgi:hypothetical protein
MKPQQSSTGSEDSGVGSEDCNALSVKKDSDGVKYSTDRIGRVCPWLATAKATGNLEGDAGSREIDEPMSCHVDDRSGVEIGH